MSGSESASDGDNASDGESASDGDNASDGESASGSESASDGDSASDGEMQVTCTYTVVTVTARVKMHEHSNACVTAKTWMKKAKYIIPHVHKYLALNSGACILGRRMGEGTRCVITEPPVSFPAMQCSIV